MKKKKLIILISIVLGLTLCGVAVFAAFVFQTNVITNSISGNVEIIKEGYVSYGLNSDISNDGLTTTEYQALLKERAGGSLVDKTVETDLATTYNHYYLQTITEATEYQADVDYYIKDDTDNYVYKNISKFETGETYYTISYTKASSYDSSKSYYRLGHKLVTLDSSASLSSYFVLSGVDLEGYALFESAQGQTYDSTKKYFEIQLHPTTLATSGLINDSSSQDFGVECCNTYGSERTGSLAEPDNYIYLNQVGFQFEIKTNIACYVRIKFRDAWISSKLYRGSSTPQVKYTAKKTIQGKSPFYVSDEKWHYDTKDNVAYLKAYMEKSDKSYSYSFTIDPTYFYESTSQTYTERMIVQVSYSLEFIQANRAKTVWGVDPSELS